MMPRCRGIPATYPGFLPPWRNRAGHAAFQGCPAWSCSGWGLPSRSVSRPLVRSYRTFSTLPGGRRPPGGVFSVALSVALRRPDVIRHPALWSSDFPLPRTMAEKRLPDGRGARLPVNARLHREFLRNEDASAVFAHEQFAVFPDLEDLLRRHDVVTPAA